VQLSNKTQSNANGTVPGCVAISTVAGVIDIGSSDKLKVVVVGVHVGVLFTRLNVI